MVQRNRKHAREQLRTSQNNSWGSLGTTEEAAEQLRMVQRNRKHTRETIEDIAGTTAEGVSEQLKKPQNKWGCQTSQCTMFSRGSNLRLYFTCKGKDCGWRENLSKCLPCDRGLRRQATPLQAQGGPKCVECTPHVHVGKSSTLRFYPLQNRRKIHKFKQLVQLEWSTLGSSSAVESQKIWLILSEG